MDKFLKIVVSIIFALAGIISVWFVICTINTSIAMVAITAFALLSFPLAVFKSSKPKVFRAMVVKMKKLVRSRYFCSIVIAIAVLVSIGIRITIANFTSYAPTIDSDQDTYIRAATDIANRWDNKSIKPTETKRLYYGSYYLALFPYTASYDNLLALTFKLTGGAWIGVIILNTIADLAIATLIYFAVLKIGRTKNLATIGACLWLLNPLGIMLSLITLPIAWNILMISLTIACAYIAIISARNLSAKGITLALTLGIFSGIANSFRPVVPVILIAFALVMISGSIRLRSFKQMARTSAICLIVMVAFGATHYGLTRLISEHSKIDVSQNSGGWSVFVGSNKWVGGIYNTRDNRYMNEVCYAKNNFNADRCQQKMLADGINRYMSYSVVDNIKFIIEKAIVFAGGVNNQGDISLKYYKDSDFYQVIQVTNNIFWVAVFSLSAITSFYMLRRNQQRGVLIGDRRYIAVIFIALILVGMFNASLLVEVKYRYQYIMWFEFIILSLPAIKLIKNGQLLHFGKDFGNHNTSTLTT